MQKAKRGWEKVPGTIRKPIIGVVGFSVIIVGIILLPLPGPGWAIIFLGFAILASEFSFAEAVRDFFIRFLKRFIELSLQALNEPWKTP